MYAVKFTDDGLADVRALSKSARQFLKKEVRNKLSREPYGCSSELNAPLKGWRGGACRKYRVVFRIFEDLQAIAVGGIGERLPQSKRDIYKRLEAAAAEGKLAEKVLRTLREFSPDW